jgi:hypothetical protein
MLKENKMKNAPCQDRFFFYRINKYSFYEQFFRWLRHLSERIGKEKTLEIWEGSFVDYNKTYLLGILADDWQETEPLETIDINQILTEFFPGEKSIFPAQQALDLVESTPPITQIDLLFGEMTVNKMISTYDALHLRFDSLATIAETILDSLKKEGELIIYDLMVESRLSASQGVTGSIEKFIEGFLAEPESPTIFTAGLEYEVIYQSTSKLILHTHQCEWARYFQERHPKVGYLMACSTDEVAYRAFNPSIRLQRTQTLMEGSAYCDFQIYSIEREI